MNSSNPVGMDRADSGDGLPLVAFDFDGTLTKRDTLRVFLTQVRSRKELAAIFARRSPQFALGLRGGARRDEAKKLLCREVLGGLSRSRVEAAASETARLVVASMMRSDAVGRVRWHQAQGHRIVVVSASFEAYVAPVVATLGISEVIATRWQVGPDDNLSGHLDGLNVRGQAKVKLLADYLDGPYALSYAYGNSSGDRELLASARHPVWIGRAHMPHLAHPPADL
jgi:phosphatidylglycerophosphatase C